VRKEKVNTLQVRTPEGVSFSFDLASPAARAVAWMLDALVITAAMMGVTWLLLTLSMITFGVFQPFLFLAWFLVPVGYGMLLEWVWKGRTIGKKVVGLRVIDEEGLPLQFRQVFMRNLLRAVDSLPVFYLVGGTTAFLNRRYQRLGDVAAGTVVVRNTRLPEPDLEQIVGGKYNTLREHARVQARLRQSIGPREANLALQAILRRNELTPAARLTLFGEIAAAFRAAVEIEPELTEGLSDEQFVRNVVDVLFRSR
jgi:uncharacterized RDD family membrane protein YckC